MEYQLSRFVNSVETTSETSSPEISEIKAQHTSCTNLIFEYLKVTGALKHLEKNVWNPVEINS